MELRQLRYFAAIAAERSFTKAAEKLHISQPPLSQQMSNLEQELGVRLLVRTSRSVELSEAGRVFLPHVLTVLERLEEGRAQLARVARGLEGRVTVGLTGSHFLGPLPRFIQAFRQQRPRVEVVLLEMAPVDQFTALGDRGIDLCFSRGIPDTPVFASDLLWRDTPVVVLPPGHPLAGREGLRLAELRDEDFVFFRLGSSLFVDAIHGACIFARFEPRIVQQVVEVSAVLNLVAAGLGCRWCRGRSRRSARNRSRSVRWWRSRRRRGSRPTSSWCAARTRSAPRCWRWRTPCAIGPHAAEAADGGAARGL